MIADLGGRRIELTCFCVSLEQNNSSQRDQFNGSTFIKVRLIIRKHEMYM